MSKGLFTKEELDRLGLTVEVAEEKVLDPNAPRTDWIVYFIGEKPDVVWTYNHNQPDGKDYGRLEGYYNVDEEKKTRTFIENKSTNLKLMPFDDFMNKVVPNKDCTKTFASKEELEEYLFMQAL